MFLLSLHNRVAKDLWSLQFLVLMLHFIPELPPWIEIWMCTVVLISLNMNSSLSLLLSFFYSSVSLRKILLEHAIFYFKTKKKKMLSIC